MSIEEMKSIQLSIMDSFHVWCEEHHYNYSIAAGTLIGAIRHKGYIPWDDDIDVYMLRQEYDKLIKEFNQCPPENLRLRSMETDDTYFTPFVKIEDTRTYLIEGWTKKYEIGVNIDIFPVDAIPDNKWACKRLFIENRLLRILSAMKNGSIHNRKKSLFRKIGIIVSHIIMSPISMRVIASRRNNLADKNDVSSRLIMDVSSIHVTPAKAYPRDVFSSRVDVSFEGRQYKAMAGYDIYLRKTYGDYMQLPPVEKRVSHHTFTPYWK